MAATIEEIEKALSASHGLKGPAAQSLGVTWQAVQNRIKKSERLQRHIKQVREDSLDYVEGKLFENIGEGNTGSSIFYLKCQGKARGYVERVETTGADGGAIEHRQIDAPPRPANYADWLEQTAGNRLDQVFGEMAGSNGHGTNGHGSNGHGTTGHGRNGHGSHGNGSNGNGSK